MKEERTKIIKKYFLNIKPILFIILLLITIYLSTKEDKLLFALGVLLLIAIIYIISFFQELKTIKTILEYKNGTRIFNYKPYKIETKKLIDEIKTYGIPLTFIKINKEIYSIEVGKHKDKYLCYLDTHCFNKLEEFLNYKLSNTSISNTKNIEVLAYNYQDPSILEHI